MDIYIEKLDERINGRTLENIRIGSPFLVRSFDPPLSDATGRKVTALRRIGKRLAINLEPDYWLVLHLMTAGRLQWHEDTVSIGAKIKLAAFDFSSGSLLLTEAGSRKKASLYLVRGEAVLAEHDPGGVEPLECSVDEFAARLTAENRTMKRALTSPRTLSGIGNAYSDEILHAACLSPVKLTSTLSGQEMERLFEATRSVLTRARETIRQDAGENFPKKVTAFREDMAVHGKFGLPCPACGAPIARIRYKSNETNYCPGCQTGGRILKDRSLSRLLKDDWPDTL